MDAVLDSYARTPITPPRSRTTDDGRCANGEKPTGITVPATHPISGLGFAGPAADYAPPALHGTKQAFSLSVMFIETQSAYHDSGRASCRSYVVRITSGPVMA